MFKNIPTQNFFCFIMLMEIIICMKRTEVCFALLKFHCDPQHRPPPTQTFLQNFFFRNLTGNVAVSDCFAVWDFQKYISDLTAKIRTYGVERRSEIRLFSAEINVKLLFGLLQSRCFSLTIFFGQIIRKIFFTVKPFHTSKNLLESAGTFSRSVPV